MFGTLNSSLINSLKNSRLVRYTLYNNAQTAVYKYCSTFLMVRYFSSCKNLGLLTIVWLKRILYFASPRHNI